MASHTIWFHLYEKSQLVRKDPDDGKDWRQKKKGTAEDKMARYDQWLSGYESEQI